MSDRHQSGSSDEGSAKVVSRTRFVPAPAQQVFDLLADPRQHHLIDGSGSVKGARIDVPARLSKGARFAMNMRIALPYRITNEVVEFDEPHRIGWRHFGGHIWRYIIEDTAGGCNVTEQFDWEHNKSPLMLKLMNAQVRNAQSIEATLERLSLHFSK
ncbi:MAG: SRPBCC family protein [Actinomycetota bacterium]